MNETPSIPHCLDSIVYKFGQTPAQSAWYWHKIRTVCDGNIDHSERVRYSYLVI